MSKITVTNETFVKFYIVSKSYAEVATSTGLSVATVTARATKLRKLGVKLPTFERVKKTVDVAALNALIV